MWKGRTRQLTGVTHVRLRQVKIVVEKGPDQGRSVDLEDGALLVGGDPSCGLVLSDDTVSGQHCELAPREGGLEIRDLGSTNGIRVNGVRVLHAFAQVGDRLQLGQTQLLLEAAGESDILLSGEDRFGPLFGQSAVMRAIFAQLEALAASSAPLLVEGETGTGKDLTAEAIHRASPRADGPFVIFDCGAVAATLLEAELFGYEKGAFTGASTAREGLAEAAGGGTLVLDEMGELPLELQPKLLRLVERREVRRVGSNTPRPVDVRIIASTHRSLRAEVKAGRFREDLYYRLSALRIRLPALRERLEDLPGLIDHLLAQHGSRRRFAELPENERQMLLSHRWPGNIRELRNVIERLLAFPGGRSDGLLESEPTTEPALESPVAAGPQELLPLSIARERAQTDFEKRYLADVLARSNGSISEGARVAGVSRQFLQRLLRKHGMR